MGHFRDNSRFDDSARRADGVVLAVTMIVSQANLALPAIAPGFPWQAMAVVWMLWWLGVVVGHAAWRFSGPVFLCAATVPVLGVFANMACSF